jgi:hypothetical protein
LKLIRSIPPCDEPEASTPNDNGQSAVLIGDWRVEGDNGPTHAFFPGGIYSKRADPNNCSTSDIGTWSFDGATNQVTMTLGGNNRVGTVTVSEDNQSQVTVSFGENQEPEVWVLSEPGCVRKPVQYGLAGTWTAEGGSLSHLAFGLAGSTVRTLSAIEGCVETGSYNYTVEGEPSVLSLFTNIENPTPAIAGLFEAQNDNSFRVTVAGEVTRYTRAQANCHESRVDYNLQGTWTSASLGAPMMALGAQSAGAYLDRLEGCEMGDSFFYFLEGSPPRLVIGRNNEPASVFSFEAINADSFRLTKEGNEWTYTRSDADCRVGPQPLDFNLLGTWQVGNTSTGWALGADEQGNGIGRELTNLAQCAGEVFFGYMGNNDPPTLTRYLENPPPQESVFRRIDDNSFTLTRGGSETTYRRAENDCGTNLGGEGGEPLDYNVLGTWTTQTAGQPQLGFTRDEHGTFGFELSSLDPCTRTEFFGLRLIAGTPNIMERMYTGENNQVDVRRASMEVVDANNFVLTVGGTRVAYTKSQSTCHDMNNQPAPPEFDAAQLVGTWKSSGGNSGYAFGGNQFKELSNVNGCVTARTGPYETTQNLLTLRYGNNERPGFFTAEMTNNNNTLRLTDDNQQALEFTRIRTNCHQ